MRKFDFDTPVVRRGTNCVKWDEMQSDDIIPLWVADMDFATAPVVVEALQKRMQHPCFGYTHVPDSYYLSLIEWFNRRHGLKMKRRWIIYTTGVVPAISATIKATAAPGESVLIMTPVYNCFFSSIRNNGCKILESPLVLKNNRYEVDWEDFEAKCALPSTTVFLLCNPHNPAGRVWTREELIRIADICQRHGVLIIDDGIHCEFVRKPLVYTPLMAVSKTPCVAFFSPSKAFNTAGLQIANIVCSDDEIRAKIDRAININETCDVNPFGVLALEAAYSAQGEEWLDAMLDYVYGNATATESFISSQLPQWKPVALEGTYLMWVDISATGMKSDEYAQHLLEKAHVYVNPGTMYAGDGHTGDHYIRINLATQRSRLMEALERISRL